MAKRNRSEQKAKREEKLDGYKSYIKSKLESGVDISSWMQLGTSYERALKLLAEREIYREMKGGETRWHLIS